MKGHVSISEALSDPALLGAGLGDLASWSRWVMTLKAAFGEKLNRAERRAFNAVAGSRKPPRERVRELWLILGRRSGKSRMAAALAVYVSLLTDARSRLAPGELGVVLVLAASKKQAATIRNYALAFIKGSPLLAHELDGEPLAEEIRLKGGVSIQVHTNSFRTVRGPTLLACIFDEVAYWRDETSATPDLETYRAILPGLSTTRGLLIAVSSPYRRTGLLHSKFRDAFGKDDPRVLVINAPTTTFNPMIDREVIAEAEVDDLESAQSEWLAAFRSDLASLFSDAVVDGAVHYDRPLELPPRRGFAYHAFADMSGGRHDAAVLCIGHAEDKHFIADVVRGHKPPFDPGVIAAEFAELAKQYWCAKIVGDNYSAEWVASSFKDAGCTYETSALPKSGLYLEALPWFNRGAVRIPDMPILLRELRLLERRVHRSGKDTVDHPRNGSDDYANVVAGALNLAVMAERRGTVRVGGWDPATSVKVYWHPEQPPKQPGLRIVSYTEKEYRERFGTVNRW